jgi:hypothetical protein
MSADGDERAHAEARGRGTAVERHILRGFALFA